MVGDVPPPRWRGTSSPGEGPSGDLMTSHVRIRRATGAALTVLMIAGLGVATAPPAARADDVDWTLRDSGAADWDAVGFGEDGSGNDLWVAVGKPASGDGPVMTSPDGITWSSADVTVSGAGDHFWNSVAYGDGRWVATGTSSSRSVDSVMTSTDGETWTVGSGLDGDYWYSVAFGEDGSGGDRWIAVGSAASSNCRPAIATSSDGLTWAVTDLGGGGSCPGSSFSLIGALRAVAHSGGGEWIATGGGGGILSTDGGATWTLTDLGAGTWGSVGHADGRWVAIDGNTSSSAKASTSVDGATWVPASGVVEGQWQGVAHGNGLWVAVARSSNAQRVMTSSDGTAWEGQWGVPGQIWNDVAFGNGQWVAVASNGTQRVMTGVPVGGATSSTSSGGTVQSNDAVDVPVAAAVAAAESADVAGSSSAVLVRNGQVVPVTSGTVAGAGPRGGVLLEAEGLTVSVAAVGGASPQTGVVAPVGGEIVCEVCAALAAGSTIEAWMYSTPQLTAAVQVPDDHEDGDCVLLTIPVGAPLTGEAFEAGAHTLQLRLPTTSGLEVLATGVTVGTPVPTSIPAGEGSRDSGLLGLSVLLGLGGLFVVGSARRSRAVPIA